MDHIDFQDRQITGGKVNQLKAQGLVPAVVYNAKGESFNIQITKSEAEKIARLATSTTIIDAKLNGKEVKSLVKEIDTDPRTDSIRHIAFFQIDENAPMVFSVPFNLVGVAPAVKNNLGVLIKALPELEVECKLADLVPAIDIDISGLEHPGQSISVSDISLPAGMTLPNDEHANSAIVTITHLQKEEEAVPVAPAEGEVAEGEEGAEPAAEGEAPADGEAAPAEEEPAKE
jgi:large subunit ribosomal protein L25